MSKYDTKIFRFTVGHYRLARKQLENEGYEELADITNEIGEKIDPAMKRQVQRDNNLSPNYSAILGFKKNQPHQKGNERDE